MLIFVAKYCVFFIALPLSVIVRTICLLDNFEKFSMLLGFWRDVLEGWARVCCIHVFLVYKFKCECGSCYVGRTNQRLGNRIKQHVPSVIRNKTRPSRQQPERLCRSSQFISCDSAVGKHLLSNKSCAETYSDDNFRILYKCRSAFQLKVMEAIYIKLNDPDLCQQKEFVFQQSLF